MKFICVAQQVIGTKTKQAKNANAVKRANILATDFVNEAFIVFKGDKEIDCDNSMRNNIKQKQCYLSECSFLVCFVYM